MFWKEFFQKSIKIKSKFVLFSEFTPLTRPFFKFSTELQRLGKKCKKIWRQKRRFALQNMQLHKTSPKDIPNQLVQVYFPTYCIAYRKYMVSTYDISCRKMLVIHESQPAIKLPYVYYASMQTSASLGQHIFKGTILFSNNADKVIMVFLFTNKNKNNCFDKWMVCISTYIFIDNLMLHCYYVVASLFLYIYFLLYLFIFCSA